MKFPTDIPGEKWAAVRDFPDYFISDHGRVWSYKWLIGRLLRAATRMRGSHATVMVSIKNKDGKWLSKKPAQLVLIAFGPKRRGRQVCRHLDGDGTHNRLPNLAWGTQAENIADAVRHGTAPAARGAKNCKAKLTAEQVLLIRDLCSRDNSDAYLAASYGVSVGTITSIRLRRTWRSLDGQKGSYVTDMRKAKLSVVE